MNINRTARLSFTLLALLSCSAVCAMPTDDLPPPAAAASTATSTAAQVGTRQDQSSTQGNKSSSTPVATKDTVATPSAAIQAGGQPDQPAAQTHKAPTAMAIKGADVTPKEAAVVAQVANPNDSSGFRLMTLSTNALLSRVSLADQAEQTIDLQYYIFKNDATGRLIALHLLQAADRGVHVRILLDDLNLVDEVRLFNALDSHPNIEVKLFNPYHSPRPTMLSRAAQFVLEFRRLNRRMHNKSFIVDNDVAVIGGRNIGDEYFDAKVDNNYRDLDVLAIGPVVPAATRSFEAYWSSDAAHPVTEYRSKTDPAIDLVSVRKNLEKNARKFDDSAYKQAAANDLPNGASADRPGNWYWGPATLVADQPEKIETGPERTDLRIGPELKTLIKNAQSEVLLMSPYFVPSKHDEENFVALAQAGVAVKILTNSLASTDELAVHEGYSSHRHALLKGGVQLFELKPAPGVKMTATDIGTSSGVSLHAKSFVVDRRYVYIGSLNMDQRSKLLNTEMGVVVDSPQLAKAVAEFFDTATSPENAYHVVLGKPDGSHPSDLHWQASKDGKDVDYDSEPDAPMHRRIDVLLLKLLPIDALL
jgi:putative cardiolipin synthase